MPPTIITAKTTSLEESRDSLDGFVICPLSSPSLPDTISYCAIPEDLAEWFPCISGHVFYRDPKRLGLHRNADALQAVARLHEAPRHFTRIVDPAVVTHGYATLTPTYKKILSDALSRPDVVSLHRVNEWSEDLDPHLLAALRRHNIWTYQRPQPFALVEPFLICTSQDPATIARLAQEHKKLHMLEVPKWFQDVGNVFLHKSKGPGGLQVIGYSKSWKSRRTKMSNNALSRQYATGFINLDDPLKELVASVPTLANNTLHERYSPRTYTYARMKSTHAQLAQEETAPSLASFIAWFLERFSGPLTREVRKYLSPSTPPRTRHPDYTPFYVRNCPEECVRVVEFVRKYWRFFVFHMHESARVPYARTNGIPREQIRLFIVAFSRLCRRLGYTQLPPAEELPGTDKFPTLKEVWAQSPALYDNYT